MSPCCGVFSSMHGFSLRILIFPDRHLHLKHNFTVLYFIEILQELKSLKSEVVSLKRDYQTMADKQNELLHLVKAIKRGCDSSSFDLGKSCHTVS